MEVDVNKLKELRLNQGLSTRALAEPAGPAPTTVWQVAARGSGNPATLKKLADVLSVKVVDLLEQD
jgi:transcriptional regulator with XRE-family HTH domain